MKPPAPALCSFWSPTEPTIYVPIHHALMQFLAQTRKIVGSGNDETQIRALLAIKFFTATICGFPEEREPKPALRRAIYISIALLLAEAREAFKTNYWNPASQTSQACFERNSVNFQFRRSFRLKKGF